MFAHEIPEYILEVVKALLPIMAFFAFVGFAVGALKIPTRVAFPITKKIGGEPIGEIIMRYAKFRQSRKMYVYTKEEKVTKEEKTNE